MNHPPSCPDDSWLRLFSLGGLAEDKVVRLEEHLSGCAACLRTLQALHDQDDLCEALRRGAMTLPRGPLLEKLQERLRGLWQTDLAVPRCHGAETPPPPEPGETPSPAGGAGIAPAEARDLLARPQLADEIGRLGPYGVLRVLGQGGMGIVFAARQTRLRRLVALKVVLASRHSRQRLARFRSETELVARLQHPNIVPIYEVGEHGGQAYYAMELVGGGSLADKLASAPLEPNTAARLVQTLAQAVQHAHERGVVHRDLKPSNVLLAADGTPKIADFGLAKPLDVEADIGPTRDTESGAIVGTPGYMAPEQAAGHSQTVGPTADVYALGAILYECLTGRPPFKAATVLATLEQVRSQEPVPPGRLQPGLPRNLQTICLMCLHKEPVRRYASAQELADDLGRFLRGEPVQARPTGKAERLWKWARRKPALAALVVVSGVSLAALVAGGVAHHVRLRAALARAEAKEEEARREHKLMVNNYRKARDTLCRMLDRLNQRPRASPQELELVLKEESLAFFRSFEGSDSPDPAAWLDMARTFVHVGMTQDGLGHNQLAEKNLRQAIALLEEMSPAQQSPSWQDQLANCYLYLGQLAGDNGRPDERERAYRQVLAICQRLAQADPNNPMWQSRLAQAESQLGSLYRSPGRWHRAEAHFARALALYTRLGGNGRLQQARTYEQLGYVYHHTRRSAEALAAFAKAEELLAPLVQEHPDKLAYRLALASLSVTTAGYFQETGQHQAARQRASRALEAIEADLGHQPVGGTIRALVREGHVKRAMAGESLGRWAEAVRDWSRAIELGDPPDLWARQRWLGALARTGDHVRIEAAAQALAKDPAINADGLWQAALAYAHCVLAAQTDARLAPAERDTLAERYASRAVTLLHRLQEQGYFQDAGRAGTLRTEAILQPLRGRADYRNLLPRE